MKIETTPACYKNWQRKIAGLPLRYIIEFPLFSDASSVGFEIATNDCPYTVINPAVATRENIVLERLKLRFGEYELPNTNQNINSIFEDDKELPVDLYMENQIPDQIAVLLSLVLGIRVKAGGISRVFQNNNDTFGTPYADSIHENPPAIRMARDHAVLPSALTNIYNINKVFSLKKAEPYLLAFIKLTAKQAELLVRAAKLYRDALWVIESDPQEAWIKLTSAVEIIAAEHIKDAKTTIEVFTERHEDLADEILKSGGNELLKKIADIFVEKKMVRRKYKKFITEFLPEPPSIRAPLNMQINWNDLKSSKDSNPLMRIYDYRSEALHAGVPFPLEMCYMYRAPGIPYHLAEKPLHLGTKLDGKHVTLKTGPMLISVYEYIVRNAILKWWESCVSPSNESSKSTNTLLLQDKEMELTTPNPLCEN